MFDHTLLSFFTDPILRAPTIGCMLMCLTAGLVGCLVFLGKQSLVGETLSHASYPGVVLGVLASGLLSIRETTSVWFALLVIGGAFLTSLLGLWMMHFMKKRLKVPSDASLCFVLASFFGIGITIASEIQFSYTNLYTQIQAYLYGQAATMTDIHIVIYGGLACLIILTILFLYKEIQTLIFDRQFAQTIAISTSIIESVLFILVVLAVIIGIRSVGVVLMSAMLIIPAATARQFTNRFSTLLVLAALFGVISGFLGNYLSVEWTESLYDQYPDNRIVLPTGPMIVIVAAFLCLMALLFAPERGLLLRLLRVARFRYQCICENVLKSMWRLNQKAEVEFNLIKQYQASSALYLQFVLWRLKKSGWVKKLKGDSYCLTPDGRARAAKIVRLHRLWEVYLANYLGVRGERVHRNAEEMEHIITPELEKELSLLLHDPKVDPHHQPIPAKEDLDVY